MNDTYLTIASPAGGNYKDKGSRFIAKVFPVHTEEEVKEHLASLKKEYYDARHHCYAWMLGYDQTNYRFNDDGEPSGTAGRPIYGQILSAGITNVLVVVVRYFGGTKLGVRGLINAYKCASQHAIENAEIVSRVRENSHSITFGYACMNEVMKIIKDYNLSITQQASGMDCMLRFSVRMGLEAEVLSQLNKIQGLSIIKN